MIALISDSHVPNRADRIPEQFIEILKQADTVAHCGDFETREMYDELDSISEEFHAVKGNCDRFEIDNYNSFETNGVKIGMYHGSRITPRGHKPTLAKTAEELNSKVLLHGHTHQQEATEFEGKILLNPGSCTGVGGGSSVDGNPRMMKVYVEDELRVEMIELVDGEVNQIELKSFEL
ncbi:YfcE family phosphodiesterase [Candidatus Nanohalococcus occultus]|uniref:YfcE family phosphodiesterase n=1 Tax=Candidatus Nanohalococcus occultus TaxID=2978047 RepID=UPI0039E0A339